MTRALMLALVLLTGCDDRPCLRHHLQPIPTILFVGKIPIVITTVVTICDERGAKP